jgi:carbon-monoxide dehydrogenase large subunit
MIDEMLYSSIVQAFGQTAAKGVGESPNVGGVSPISNAVNDAFAHLGVTHMLMPHDDWRVWQTAQNLGLTGKE